jgi:hypothetical protein
MHPVSETIAAAVTIFLHKLKPVITIFPLLPLSLDRRWPALGLTA